MKNYILIVLCGSALTLVAARGATPAAAMQAAKKAPASKAPAKASVSQVDALVKADLSSCGREVPVIPQARAQTFSEERIAKTLNGLWRGRVSGRYDKKFLSKDGFLNVDYYMIIDTKQGEVLILEQLSDKRSLAAPRTAATTPTWSFVMCGGDRYLPRHPAQVHEFQKVSDNTGDVRSLVQTSTGLAMDTAAASSLSATWQQLVSRKYFDDQKFPAYAGGLFKPFTLANVAAAAAGAPGTFSMSYEAEYRGAGATAAKFTTGVPIRGRESAEFVGMTAPTGDFLIASVGNGRAWKKEASSGGAIDMQFDKVILGPLER